METTRAGGRLRAFRKLKGHTQQSFANQMHMSVSVIGEIERGTRRAEDEFLEQACALLGITTEELLGKDHNENEVR
ncbi:transcriptional regulator with XRE-family HTH domain [Geomicrobium halophilum]|uniref:Transcriptional regulator with XRE-family HTH domain n=1 Tax=Geomicrobium halophilum TaxID=549000 RepID=A0A841Q2U9_9BACL|nr:helix-turn-helix transcriptional regulator [Geomicrobium halophilum]MBB6451568.1 transcriptional regulator with XRE-family HTH domain [Geomicrobium halophilum]